MKKIGKVYLLGSGPGDPSLVTLRGKEILETCDAVVYDYLAPRELVELSGGAQKIYAGKKGGEKSHRQAAINRLLIRLAKQGKTVARLKGGDPLLFGRGAEEGLDLRQNKIPFEIVPGITAALGAAAYAGIPLTHRDWASSVCFVTAREASSKRESAIPWRALAGMGGTLVFYMSVRSLGQVVRRLTENGLSLKTRAAVIQWATTPAQKFVAGTLENIVARALKARITAPAVTIVGEVVRLQKKLNWFSRGPLRGKTVLITRARHQASLLRRDLESLGARVLEYPTIEIRPPETWTEIDRAMDRLSHYDWVIFTSANGVETFMARLFQRGHDVRSFAGVKICAIGPATESKLRFYHLRADLIPPEYVSESLAAFLSEKENLSGKKILLLRANLARNFLKEELARKGARVDALTVYRTEPARTNGKGMLERFRKGQIDFVTFTSSSTVKNFVAKIGKKELRRIKDKTHWVSIGPVTSETARGFGLKIHRQAAAYTVRGLVEALLKE